MPGLEGRKGGRDSCLLLYPVGRWDVDFVRLYDTAASQVLPS